MIAHFGHRGLHLHHETGNARLRPQPYVRRITRILLLLDRASHPRQMDISGFRFHALKGDLEGFWSVTVSGNWRIIFRFANGNAVDVDLVDYH